MIKYSIFFLLFFGIIFSIPEMDVDFSLGLGMFFCFCPLLFMNPNNKFPLIQLVSIYNFFAYISPMIFHLEGYRYAKDVPYLRTLLPSCQILMLLGYYLIASNNKNTLRFSSIKFIKSSVFDNISFSRFLNVALFLNIFDLFPIEPTLQQIARPFSFLLPCLLVYLLVKSKFKEIPIYSLILLITFVFIKTISLALGGLLLPFLMYLFLGFYVLVLYKRFVILFFLTLIFLSFSFKLNSVKSSYRQSTWYASKEVTLFEKLSIFNELILKENSIEVVFKKKINENTELLRFAHGYFYLCTVINQLDYTNDYYNGTTYLSIFTKIIPRAVWPDKPKEDFGQSIGRAFNLLDIDDTSTSVNLPIWVEFYINFGMDGLVIMSFLLGLLLGYISLKLCVISKYNLLDTAIKFSLLANLYYMESNFTMRFGLLIPQIYVYKFIVKKIWRNA